MRLAHTAYRNIDDKWLCRVPTCRAPATKVFWLFELLYPYCDDCAERSAKYQFNNSATIEEAKLLLIKENL